MESLKKQDRAIYDLIQDEAIRQKEGLELIASENYVSSAVLEAAGSILTNKYAEGYPYRWSKKTGDLNYKLYGRYYGGCCNVDKIEKLAVERAKELFGAEHANVQPHSGSTANMAAYFSLVQPGDTVLAMELSHGGHLTHGSPLSFSGMLYNIVSYGVDASTQMLDYDYIQKLAVECKPKMILAGASAYSRKIDFARFRKIADLVDAYLVVDMAHIAGLVAAGLHQSPVPYADIVTTTTHKTLRGPRSGLVLCKEKYAKLVDKVVFPGLQGGPLEHIIAAKAVAFAEALDEKFVTYQKQVLANAQTLASCLFDFGFKLVSGGTDNHLVLWDLGDKDSGNPSGKKMENALGLADITVNKNAVPFDTRSPFVASGIRLGTAAVTTRGMKEAEMIKISEFIKRVYDSYENEFELAKIGLEVKSFCKGFPVCQ